MKKYLIIIILLFITTGCSVQNLNNMPETSIVDYVINSETNLYNQNKIGYRYYLPRTFGILRNDDYNEILYGDGYKYYLYVDVISKYNKKKTNYTLDKNAYLSYQITNKDIEGFLEINKINNYFYLEMVYNYAKIEVLVKERDIKKAITNTSYILASIKYNDSVISNIVGENVLNYEEKEYEIAKPKKKTDAKDFLQVVKENDQYTGKTELHDKDLIGN